MNGTVILSDKLEKYFSSFRKNIIGNDIEYLSPYGKQKLIYADWIASGRLFKPIEDKLISTFGPFVGNTHSESSTVGSYMTKAYQFAHQYIKNHVNANDDDIIITAGSGMTKVINKFQRILGLKIPEQLKDFFHLPEELKPVVFITHMEHHSNHTSWLETIADVVIIQPDKNGLVDLDFFENEIKKYKNRKLIIGSFTACSNVTGIHTPYYQLAEIVHNYGGFCFVDFAASAPYEKIDMNPENKMKKIDALFFSPHKFLGGPGTPGVLIFDSKLYHNRVPDDPGGGTVDWTNPWGHHKFTNNIELREDGGTPPFLQTIKAALAIKLKEQMGINSISEREKQLVELMFNELTKIPKLKILADNIEDRLGVFSFYIENIHYNLIVKLLSDRFGIQTRGGCSCAGTYGHYLLNVTPEKSRYITDKINHGDFSEKPGWVRISLHPTMTDDEVYFIVDALKQIVKNIDNWEKDYTYNSSDNEYHHFNFNENRKIIDWFNLY